METIKTVDRFIKILSVIASEKYGMKNQLFKQVADLVAKTYHDEDTLAENISRTLDGLDRYQDLIPCVIDQLLDQVRGISKDELKTSAKIKKLTKDLVNFAKVTIKQRVLTNLLKDVLQIVEGSDEFEMIDNETRLELARLYFCEEMFNENLYERIIN